MDAQLLDVVQLEARQLPGIPDLPIPPILPSLSLPEPTLGLPTRSRTTTTPTTTPTTTTSSSSSSRTTSETSTSTTSTSTTPTSTPTEAVLQTLTGPARTQTITAPNDSTTSNAALPTTAPTGFLQNKVLSGVVFGLVGLVVLVILVILGTCMVRRRRNKRLFQEAINFDPVTTAHIDSVLEEGKNVDKARMSGSSSGHGHGNTSWTAVPVHGQPNQYAIGPFPGQNGQGQSYVPPPSWSTTAHTGNNNARYLPPSQLYRSPEANYPGANVPGY